MQKNWRQLRDRFTSIISPTDKGEVADKDIGLEIGMEDSVTKHFSVKELAGPSIVRQIEKDGEKLHFILAVR